MLSGASGGELLSKGHSGFCSVATGAERSRAKPTTAAPKAAVLVVFMKSRRVPPVVSLILILLIKAGYAFITQ